MKINELQFNEGQFYTGQPLEQGKTSIASHGDEPAAPAIKDLFKDGIIRNGMTVLDFGAGKFHRNSTFLRKLGVKVFPYDPFNGEDGADGWGKTSKTFPRNIKFDVVFTSFVLNVVPYNMEKNIILQTDSLGHRVVHIVRNMDIVDTLKGVLTRDGSNPSKIFFKTEYAKAHPELLQKLDDKTLTKDDMIEYAKFGVQTSRGFQRIPELEENGFELLVSKHGYKVYIK